MSADSITSSFLFVTCQLGAERAIKDEIARNDADLRFAYSRPGFLTFKSVGEPFSLDSPPIGSFFARNQGFVLGKVEGSELTPLAQNVWDLPQVCELLRNHQVVDLHVWQRDWAKPGWRGFRPGFSSLAESVEFALREASPNGSIRLEPRHASMPSPRGTTVLDVVLVEPNQWWIGCHKAQRWPARWPGGVFPVVLPENAISRAYGKMAEALAWSRLPITAGESIVELGCAPGGSSQALLERGLRVVGIDPAEVDPDLLAAPDFTHLRKRSSAVRRQTFRKTRWLAADMNVAPQYTLDAVESIVASPHAHIRGLILTLKLPDWALAQELPAYLDRVRTWGYHDVRARQLALAGQEVCVVALPSRSHRRLRKRRN